MKYRFFIARRYLFSRKSHAVINLISIISIVSVCLITASMVIILSAINGFETVVEDLYGEFDPDLRIVASHGKSFELDSLQYARLVKTPGVTAASRVVEETGIIKSGDKWIHATLKGVESGFFSVSRVADHLESGEPDVKGNGALAGSLVAARLGIFSDQAIGFDNMVIYIPLRSQRMGFAKQPFAEMRLTLNGVFKVNPEYDDQLVLMNFNQLQNLLEYENDISAIEIKTESNQTHNVAEALRNKLGNDFRIQSRYQINEIIYKTNQAEKWFTFLILVFIMLLAAFNIVSSLTMLVIDKRTDMQTLAVMGAHTSDLRHIFFMDGMLINLAGGITGMGFGILICVLQQKYHFVGLGNAVIDYYPVKIMLSDMLFIFSLLVAAGGICAWLPAAWLVRKNLKISRSPRL